MKLTITYLIDNDNWSDEDFENQKEQTLSLDDEDLVFLLTYGKIKQESTLSKHETISQILSIN